MFGESRGSSPAAIAGIARGAIPYKLPLLVQSPDALCSCRLQIAALFGTGRRRSNFKQIVVADRHRLEYPRSNGRSRCLQLFPAHSAESVAVGIGMTTLLTLHTGTHLGVS